MQLHMLDKLVLLKLRWTIKQYMGSLWTYMHLRNPLYVYSYVKTILVFYDPK